LRPSLTILRKKFEDFSLEEILNENEPFIDSNDNWERFAKLRDQIADMQFQLGGDLPAHLQDALDKGFEKIHYQMNRQLEIGKRFYDEKSGNRKKRWHHARMELGIGGEPQERRKTLLEAVMEWGNEGIAEMHALFSANRANGVIIVREQTNG
ncbi:MAG: hypothetical protein OEM52_12910, partial [bacterium]|nr:hypothetical protein [bacterium]